MIYCMYVCVSSVAQTCPALCDSYTIAHQATLSMEFSKQEYWSGLPFPPGGDLPDSWDWTHISSLAGGFSLLHDLWDPGYTVCCCCPVAKSVWLFVTPCTAALQAPLSSTVSWSLLKLCPLYQWCSLIISFSATPFSFCLQSFLISGYFPWVSSLHQVANGVSASPSVLPMNQYQFIQYQFIHSVVSDTLWPHGM